MAYKIVLTDNHPILRAGLKQLLEQDGSFKIVKEARDCDETFKAVVELHPDLVIFDLSKPDDCIKTISKIKHTCLNVKILVLTAHREEKYVRACLESGVDGYMLKDDSYDDLLTAVRSVVHGKIFISPSICKFVVHGYLGRAPKHKNNPSWECLTKREHQVVKLAARGMNTREIAGQLCVSPKTIENHRSNLMNKLKFKNMAALVCYAAENGLL